VVLHVNGQQLSERRARMRTFRTSAKGSKATHGYRTESGRWRPGEDGRADRRPDPRARRRRRREVGAVVEQAIEADAADSAAETTLANPLTRCALG
jgi:hypothetical protein